MRWAGRRRWSWRCFVRGFGVESRGSTGGDFSRADTSLGIRPRRSLRAALAVCLRRGNCSCTMFPSECQYRRYQGEGRCQGGEQRLTNTGAPLGLFCSRCDHPDIILYLLSQIVSLLDKNLVQNVHLQNVLHESQNICLLVAYRRC